jgi:threonine/homoserine/homoserine lactone efflux protein
MEVYASIFLFCFVTTITPGPNNIMLMASGLNHGVKKTMPHYLGIVVGFPAMVAALGLGLGAVFLNFPVVHNLIKVAGSIYLLYLAWKIANSSNQNASESLRKPLTFMQAAVFQWINPKAWVIAVGGIATYTTVGNVKEPVLIILLGYLSVGSLCMAFWLLTGRYLQGFIHHQKQMQVFNLCMAVLLAGSIVTMAFSQLGTP